MFPKPLEAAKTEKSTRVEKLVKAVSDFTSCRTSADMDLISTKHIEAGHMP
jgi:hypothetical protein